MKEKASVMGAVSAARVTRLRFNTRWQVPTARVRKRSMTTKIMKDGAPLENTASGGGS